MNEYEASFSDDRQQVHAVLMAGGLGTRLRPVTDVLPKILLPVAGRPLLDYVLDRIVAAGIHRVDLMLGHSAGLINAYVGANRERWPSLRLTANVEDTPLGTAGPLGLLEEPNSHLLVLNGDVLTDADLGDIAGQHIRSGADLTVVAAPHATEVPFAVLESDGSGQITSLVEKPTYQHRVAAGMYVLGPRCRSVFVSRGPDDMPALVARALAAKQVVREYRLDSATTWCEIGTAPGYAEARQKAAALQLLEPASSPRKVQRVSERREFV
ncbi:sugar phosphate nucleotidyltransferase [Streptomyces sp. NPDC088270]|uniref:sugar phosphate nucleotidyltransferase n=1 Tax=Streptomyces sp. NPDC088270 TaxID=3160990 RepID=UPI00342E7D32